MSPTYACSFAHCGMLFTKAYELKKHAVTHSNPDSVFRCPECDFFTLQKKNLGIHIAIHTGEKAHTCPHTIKASNGSSQSEQPCPYRTNDPAALTKHRKKVHQYMPPPNRRRPAKPDHPSPRKPVIPRRSLPGFDRGMLNQAEAPNGSPDDPIDVDEQGNSPRDGLEDANVTMDQYWLGIPGYDPALLVAPKEEMGLDLHYDPTLHPEWMARYELSYSLLDVTDMKDFPAPMSVDGPPGSPSMDVPTARGVGLCREWVVEAGMEDWD